MIKAIELEEWSNDVLPILRDINISITNLRIINIENSKNLTEIRNGFFRYLWRQQRFVLIIQLAKLFSENENQKRNFLKLLKRLECQSFDQHIKSKLKENKSKFTDVFRSREDIINAIKEIRNSLQEHADTIEKITTLRDEVYAHTDPERNLLNVDHTELEALVSIATKIYNTMFGKIFDRYFRFEDTGDWDLRFVIELIKKSSTIR